MERKICAFTGHRVIKAEHELKLSDLLERAIKYAYDRGCVDFYAGGAIGFDTAAAREVLKFRLSHPDVRLVLILPCRNQSEKWSERQKAVYDFILNEANEIRYVSDIYRDGCLKERNMRLVENAEMLVAYVGRSDSGAAQTARMARTRGIDVYNLYPKL